MKVTNLYLVPNNKNPHGGRFYNIYKNQGERLDLSEIINPDDIDSLEEDVRRITGDESFKRIGGVITCLGEEIETTNVYNGFSNSTYLPQEVVDNYEKLVGNYQLIDRIQAENRVLLAEINRGKTRVLRRKPGTKK